MFNQNPVNVVRHFMTPEVFNFKDFSDTHYTLHYKAIANLLAEVSTIQGRPFDHALVKRQVAAWIDPSWQNEIDRVVYYVRARPELDRKLDRPEKPQPTDWEVLARQTRNIANRALGRWLLSETDKSLVTYNIELDKKLQNLWEDFK